MIYIANKLIIFGGMNNNNYLGSSFLIINLDFTYIPLIISNLKGSEAKNNSNLLGNNNNKENGKDKGNADGTATMPKNLPSLSKKVTANYIETTQCIIKNQLGIVKDLDLPPIR